MPKRKHTVKKHALLILCLKICCIILLWLVPINVSGDINAQSQITANQPISQQEASLDYWPPVIAKLEAAYAQNPQDQQVMASLTNAYNNYGVLLAQNKQWDLAESNLQQAIDLSPNDIQIKKNLSNIYFEQGNELYQNRTNDSYTTYTHATVEQLANKAIQFDPQNANAYLLLGDVEYMNQDMLAAQRNWKQAAALLPDNAAVQQRLAQINRETSTESDMSTVFNPLFNIKIDQTAAQNPNFDINKILTYAYDSVAPDFEYIQHDKVPVVVYNTQEFRATMVDAPGWAGAVYDGKIRLVIAPDQTDFKQITSNVAHEYTHVIVGVLTDNNCPRWFNEGLAKFEEYKHGIPPRIYLLAMAFNSDELIPWDKLNEAIVSPDPGRALQAYQQSFSFVFYLVQRYGMQKVVDLLKALGTKEDFETAVQQVYGIPIATIENNWKLWLTDFITNWAESPVSEDLTS